MPRNQDPLDFFGRLSANISDAPERIAFQHITSDQRQAFSYGDVGRETRILSRYLQDRQIKEGSRVGLLIENHPRWGIAFLAAQSAGAVVVPLDILHEADVLAYLIEHSECDFLFASESTLPKLQQIQQSRSEPIPALVLGDSNGNWPEWEEVIDSGDMADGPLPLVSRSLDEPHLVLYTSGTTGSPKGVVLTGRNLYRNIVETVKLTEIRREDHFLGVLPLYHILALQTNFIAPLYVGSRTTFLDSIDAQLILKTFREEGITVFVCVPQFYTLLHRRIWTEVEKQGKAKRWIFHRLFRFSRFWRRRFQRRIGTSLFGQIQSRFGDQLRVLGVGGARFDQQVAEDLNDFGFPLIQAYGMTETAAIVTVTPPAPVGIGSVGKPLPHTEIKIREPNQEGIGEVLIRGENIMQGYLKNPEATEEAIDGEGWLHSGDLGHISQEGFLYITGRAKDVIVLSSGKNIFPEEVEQFYEKRCKFIKEICVLGISEEEEGDEEKLHAVIVPDFEELKREQVANSYEMLRYLMETLSQDLPSYKRVHSFEIWQESLPRTTTRKIKRFEVEEKVREARQAAEIEEEETAWEPQTTLEKEVARILREVKPRASLQPEKNLELDIGLDSLERVEFLSSLQERFQVEISDEESSQLLKLQEVFDLLDQKLSGEVSETHKSQSWAEILDSPLNPEEQQMVDDRLRRRFFVEAFFVFVARLTWLASKILFRLRGRGQENLPHEYPFMICPNHLSYLDAFVVVALLPTRVIRRWFALGYSNYFSGGLAGFLGRLIKTIPVDADRNLRNALKAAARGLRSDLVLGVFPEGERSIDGTLKPFRKGPAILAVHLKVPVVPTAIRGSYEVWRRGSSKIRLHPIQVIFGKPLHPEEGESPEDFNQRLREAVERLLEELD